MAQRAMFIIDPRSVVRQVTTNDANVGRSVDEARRLVDALEFTDEFGEGCPIDWKKGDQGVRMGSNGSSKSSKKRASSGASNGVTSPQSAKSPRPGSVRQNTWSGNMSW